MTAKSPLEQSLTDWLSTNSAGPAPTEVLAGALERVADSGQDRFVTQRLFGDQLGRLPAVRWAIVLALLALALAGAAAVAGSLMRQPAPPGIGAFQPGPPLLVGRGNHTTTLLPDGRVLVVGGSTHPEAVVPLAESTELWDSAAGRAGAFVHGGPLLEERSRHTATLLSDGRVLVVGGASGRDVRASAEMWDPTTGTFSPAGALAQARFGQTATLLPDGRALIAGGTSGFDPDSTALASLEIWDPNTLTFSPAGELGTPHSGHAALTLADGRVLFVGDSETDLWDPATGVATRGPSLVEPRYFHTVTLLGDGRVLVAGGMWGSNEDIVVRASAEIWDPRTASFELVESLSVPRAGHTATLLQDGRVLIAGGDDPVSAEVWDPRTGAFSATGSPIVPRVEGTATVLPDGSVLFVGSMSRQGITEQTEIWNPTGQPMPSSGTPATAPPSTPRPVQSSG